MSTSPHGGKKSIQELLDTLKLLEQGGFKLSKFSKIQPSNLSIEDDNEVLDKLINDSEQYIHVTMTEPVVDQYPVAKEYMPLYRFFNGQLTPEDISRISHLKVAPGSFDSQYLSENTILSTQPHNRLIVLWQFGDNAAVNTIHLNPPIIGFSIKDVIPPRLRARRVAVISYNDISAYIAPVYLLTGLVSIHDPIHEILKNER